MPRCGSSGIAPHAVTVQTRLKNPASAGLPILLQSMRGAITASLLSLRTGAARLLPHRGRRGLRRRRGLQAAHAPARLRRVRSQARGRRGDVLRHRGGRRQLEHAAGARGVAQPDRRGGGAASQRRRAVRVQQLLAHGVRHDLPHHDPHARLAGRAPRQPRPHRLLLPRAPSPAPPPPTHPRTHAAPPSGSVRRRRTSRPRMCSSTWQRRACCSWAATRPSSLVGSRAIWPC